MYEHSLATLILSILTSKKHDMASVMALANCRCLKNSFIWIDDSPTWTIRDLVSHLQEFLEYNYLSLFIKTLSRTVGD